MNYENKQNHYYVFLRFFNRTKVTDSKCGF